MAKIGPSIGDELDAAGVAGLPFSWRESDGVVRTDDPALTPSQRTAILAVFAAHSPLKKSKQQTKDDSLVQAKIDFLAHCTVLEGDATLPQQMRKLGTLLKKIV
jgi:hypothetical protein